MKYVDNKEVEQILLKDPKSYLNYLYERINQISKGLEVWVQPKIIYADPINPQWGDIRPMTCFTDRVKVVKVISTNPIRKKTKHVSVGSVLSLDYEENFPHAIYAAPCLSSIRTAALAHIIMRITGHNYNDVLLIGTGEVGKYFLKLSPDMKKIKTYDIKNCTKSSDYKGNVIISATTSRKAFINPENSKFNLLISLGADTLFNFEVASSLLTSKEWVYVDTFDSFNVGDLSISRQVKRNVKGTLLDLAREKLCDIFVSVGSPLMDALTIEYIEGTKKSHEGYKNRK